MNTTRRIELTEKELADRIRLNQQRLCEPYYQIDGIFQDEGADWPGDKEGRALLAFVSHYKATGFVNPCMQPFLDAMPSRTNEHLYFGPRASRVIYEQQLSGHSWLLRGLCEHYEVFGDAFSLSALKEIVKYLYLPTRGRYTDYPTSRDEEALMTGGVSGHSTEESQLGDWCLSTDVGCAFMSIDGLSHVYKITKDSDVLALVGEMIEVFSKIDKARLHAQTHCTLTAGRGMMRMYEVTGDEKYLRYATDIYNLYVYGGGMDAVYQNLNWWGRPDTWTEPCAIVDSLMLSLELYKATKQDTYRRCAARIWHNGLASAQRPNGGAGTDSVVLDGQPELYLKMYEAYFCCTMRLAEGLWYAHANRGLLYCEAVYSDDGTLIGTLDERSRYVSGDLILTRDGQKFAPLVKYYQHSDDFVLNLRQRILYN